MNHGLALEWYQLSPQVKARQCPLPGLGIEHPAVAALNKAMLLKFKKETPQAIEVIQKALKLFKTAGHCLGQAYCLLELAWLAGVQHEKATANRYFKRAEALIDQNPDEPFMLEAKTRLLHYRGLLKYEPEHYGEAVCLFKEALSICDADGMEAARIYDSLGVHYERTGDYHRAVRVLKHALQIKQQAPDMVYEEAITSQILGRLYLIYEEFELSLSHLERAMEVARTLKDEKRIAQLHIELIRLNIRLGKEQHAQRLIQQARQECEHRRFYVQLAFTYFYEAFLEYQHSHFQHASSLLQSKVLTLFSRQKYKKGLAYYKRLNAWVDYAIDPKQYRNCIAQLGEAIALFREQGQVEEMAKTHFELGKFYAELNKSELALTSYMDALKIAEENGLFYLLPYIEDEIYQANTDQWKDIINKRTSHQRLFETSNPLAKTLAVAKASKNVKSKSGETDKSVAFLMTLLRISQAIAGVRDMDALLQMIANETKNALEVTHCRIYLFDEDTNTLWKPEKGNPEPTRFAAHEGIAGYVLKTGQCLSINDAANDPRFNPDVDQHFFKGKLKNLLCVPMRNRKGAMVGVFQLINKNAGAFETGDEDLLNAISTTAAVALENATLYQELKITFESFIKTLSSTIDARDPITAGHSERVTAYALLIGEKMMLTEDEMEALKYAGLLHDIGKIGVREEVLMKEGRLTVKEYEHIQSHVVKTSEILQNIRFEKHLSCVPAIACAHHEKWDGTGYFQGLKGEEIPLGGRILALADVFDAITSRRQYRTRMAFDRVMHLMKEESNYHFDTDVVEAMMDCSIKQVAEVLCFDNELLKHKDDIETHMAQIPAEMTMRQYLADTEAKKPTAATKTIQKHFDAIYHMTPISELD